MTTNRWTAKRRASLALWSFVMLVVIVEGALYFWTVELLPEYSSRIHYYFSMTILFCGILLLASLALSKGKPIFRR